MLARPTTVTLLTRESGGRLVKINMTDTEKKRDAPDAVTCPVISWTVSCERGAVTCPVTCLGLCREVESESE